MAEITLDRLVRQLDRIDATRLHGDSRDVLPRNHASQIQARLEIFEFRHGQSVVGRTGFGLTGWSE